MTDSAGNTFEKAVSVTVENNVAPTDIELSNDRVTEGQSAGAYVGALMASDANTSDTFTYALVSGEGDTDNGKFRVEQVSDYYYGNYAYLATNTEFSVDADTVYSVRLQVTDSAGNTFEKAVSITVENNVAPTV